MRERKSQNFLAKARTWTTQNGLHGPHAFLRFVMLVFVERLNQISNEFIFKGGNLLWIYIRTPRATVDLDFTTRSLVDDTDVRRALELVCSQRDGHVTFSIKSFTSIAPGSGGRGAAVKVSYRTEEGQENTFDLDIIYAIPSVTTTIALLFKNGTEVHAVTIENIVADKLGAAHKFRSGNSRMKDFDDLWRISVVTPNPLHWPTLREILRGRSIPAALDVAWISTQMEDLWKAHIKRNTGLPTNLQTMMQSVNAWMENGVGS